MGLDAFRRSTGTSPRLRWAVWFVALAAYTYLLVVPGEWLPPWLRSTTGTRLTDEFTLGKLAHAVWYALFTFIVFVLPLGGWGRTWWVVALSLHGFATEYVQTFTGRNGRWMDVLIDNIGVAAGLLLYGAGRRLRRGGGLDRPPERVTAAPQVQQHAGGEDDDADPL